jgi:hypothetical protein
MVRDAERISKLIIELAEEFIVKDFTAEGRSRFLRELSVTEMEQRLAGDFRFYLAENGQKLAGVAAMRSNAHLYYLFVAKQHIKTMCTPKRKQVCRASAADVDHILFGHEPSQIRCSSRSARERRRIEQR